MSIEVGAQKHAMQNDAELRRKINQRIFLLEIHFKSLNST